MNTDSILRSYYNVSSSMFVPFAVAPGPDVASDLLSGETQGFAIDATTYDEATDEVYVGGPVGGTVAVIDTGTPANNLSDVALDSSTLVNSGTSPKMVHNTASPYVRWAPHNLCLQSQTLGTTWTTSNSTVSANATTAPDGTSTADSIVEATDSGQVHKLDQTGVVTITDMPYTYSAYVKAGTGSRRLVLNAFRPAGDGCYAVFDIAGAQVGVTATQYGLGVTPIGATIASAGSGWYRCTLSIFAGDTSVTLQLQTDNQTGTNALSNTFNGNGSSLHLWGVQVNRGYTATPYLVTTTAARMGIPQSYDAAEAQYGILVEPAATNLAQRSEDFSTTWVNDGSTESTNTTTAPDGSTTADTMTENAANQRHIIYQNVTSPLGTHAASIYVKKKDRRYVALGQSDGAGTAKYTAIFDLDDNATITNTVGVGGVSAAATSVGGGWFRLTLAMTGSSGANPYLIFGHSNSATPSYDANNCPTYTGDNTSGTYIWGAQVETGSIATSYIPTLGATATRARDQIGALTSSVPQAPTALSFYVWGKTLSLIATSTFITWADTSEVDTNSLYFDGSIDINLFAQETSPQAQFTVGTTSLNTVWKTAARFKANDYHGAVNGTLSGSPDTSGTYSGDNASIDFIGFDNGGHSQPTHCYIYQIVYLPRDYSNAQLQSVTTP